MPLSLLSPPAAIELHQPNVTRILKPYQLFPSSRDSLWQIQRGIIRTTTVTEDGRLIVLGYWGAGDIVGHAMSQLYAYQIECLTEVEVSLLRQAQWSQSVDALLGHIHQVQEFLSIVHQKPTERRLWQFLNFLARKFGVEVEQGMLIDLNLSHQAIAETINATRVTVTRLLQKFEDEGLLLRQKKQLILR
jgi:CRP-like cAMP-binding protein